jgi:hypothetical protein
VLAARTTKVVVRRVAVMWIVGEKCPLVGRPPSSPASTQNYDVSSVTASCHRVPDHLSRQVCLLLAR